MTALIERAAAAANLRKVAINVCHGGFGLSDEAFVEFMRRKGVTVHAEPRIIGSNFWTTPLEEQPSILRTDRHKLPPDMRGEYDAAWEAAGPVYPFEHIDGERRDDPDLIAVIEEFGPGADGKYAALRIVEIPADIEWEIEEYDGSEWIAEKHRTWR